MNSTRYRDRALPAGAACYARGRVLWAVASCAGAFGLGRSRAKPIATGPARRYKQQQL